jgi:hypothetical protein
MIIKDMFLKDIDREIRGVIKADQTSNDDIYQELNEYVVTKELHRHLSKFYENYLKSINGKTDKVGVWISGFFGSGKSHFLKILSYLLENKELKSEKAAGKRPIDFFEDKISDPVVYANMEKTANVPTETILFNIDSKSPLDNKEKEDAILRVLIKVFNEHRGYYGDNPVVAELEKYLDDQGYLEMFKTEFEKAAGEPWLNRRHSFYFDTHYVRTALINSTDMTEEAVDTWLNHGADNVEISIEKFAHEVKSYIDTKEPDFHLVFLIDEVGQYIGDRRDLMLNLQTVTENLGAICQGQAWVMVTSQESIDSIVKVKGDDFSRIQGRFDTRLSLSSISVDEVIQKRILEKEDYVEESLKATYPEKGPILRNTITFRDSTADLRGYEDEIEYAEVYPFVPYQYRLLQNVFEQVRKHGSSGKHLSEGERSMLSAYQEAGIRYMNEEEGVLIPFYAFYDTIREFLQPTITRVIENAAENPKLKDDAFNVDLLKVLFMIKYVKEVPANIDNIATLMVTHIDEDKLELKEKINSSLRKLISETLIQKNGEEYDFLTDDEQDINREIKTMMVEEEVVKKELAEYIFQDLVSMRRYSYSKWYNFPFNQVMDEVHYGNQTSSIGMNILSPQSEHYHATDQELMMQSHGTNEVIIKLGGNESYIEELEAALQIEQYRASRNISQLPENIQNILNNKQAEVRDRRRRVRSFLEDALKNSKFFINGSQVDIKGATIMDKINEALKILVENTYQYLPLIQDFIDQESDLKAFLVTATDQVTLDDQGIAQTNNEAVKMVEEYIQIQADMNKQIRIKPLYDRFTNAPYGWRELDIAKIIAGLLKEQRIRIRYNAEYLDTEKDVNKLMTIFTKTKEADKAIITVRQQIDENLIRSVRRIARDLFDKRDLADDEDGLVKDIRHQIELRIEEINSYKKRYEGRKYPGFSLLDKGLEYFSKFDHSIDNLTFFQRFKDMEDDLAYWFEDILSVKSFFGANQKDIFDNGLQALNNYEENKSYVQTEEVETAMESLDGILNDPLPYSRIKDIPKLVYVLEEQMQAVLKNKKEIAREKVQLDHDEVSLQANQYGVSQQTKSRIDNFYNNLLSMVDSYTDIHKVDAAITRSNSNKSTELYNIKHEIEEWIRKKEKEHVREEDDGEEPIAPEQIPQEPIIQKETVDVFELMNVDTLTTEEDVDKYINTLSNKLKEIIRQNKQVIFKK